jgi:hypothetical protein
MFEDRAFWCCTGILFGMSVMALAQQLPDASKLAPIYQQQRNAEADGRAQCYAIVVDLQARIADLEKQLAAAKTEPKDEH